MAWCRRRVRRIPVKIVRMRVMRMTKKKLPRRYVLDLFTLLFTSAVLLSDTNAMLCCSQRLGRREQLKVRWRHLRLIRRQRSQHHLARRQVRTCQPAELELFLPVMMFGFVIWMPFEQAAGRVSMWRLHIRRSRRARPLETTRSPQNRVGQWPASLAPSKSLSLSLWYSSLLGSSMVWQ